MSAITWHEGIPSITSIVGSFPRYAQSVWTNISGGMATEHYWPGTGGGSDMSIGDLLPGASRAFFDLKSRSSSAGSGFLYLTSDTSQLLASISAGTWQLGTPFQDSVGSSAGTNFWARQTGTSMITDPAGVASSRVTFPIPFVNPPAFYVTISSASFFIGVNTISAATVDSLVSGLANSGSTLTYFWEAFGLLSMASV